VSSAPVHDLDAPPQAEGAPLLFFERSCPFGHRVRSLCAHLDVRLTLREGPAGALPPGLDIHAKGGHLPLYVQGTLVLTETRAVLEHLAELTEFADAFPPELAARTLHRNAMGVADRVMFRELMRPDPTHDPAALEDSVSALGAAASVSPPRPCLLTFHLAPLWLHLRVLRPEGRFTRAVLAQPALAAWLDAGIQVEAVRATGPELGELHADFATVLRQQCAARAPDPESSVSRGATS
jgi:glutathione S-transferase